MALPFEPPTESFDPGALLGRSYALTSGQRVRLRLPHVRDMVAIASLYERTGAKPEHLELARLVRFDPIKRLVVCATQLIGSSEVVLGVGAIELDAGEPVEPDLLVVDEAVVDTLRPLLRNALVGRAKALARRRAA